MTIIDDVLNDSIGTTAYAPLTDTQTATILRMALNPNNRFLPINSPIRTAFLLRFIDALIAMKGAARKPYGMLLDELIHSYKEILRIGRPTQVPQLRGVIIWNLGVTLSNRFDENGIKQDLEDSINVARDCLAIAKDRKRDRKSTRLNSSHSGESRMPSSA